MLTFTLISEPLVEHKAFLSTWCKTVLHTREKEVFFPNTLKISLAQSHQNGPYQVMFVETQQKKQKKQNTRKRKDQDTAKRRLLPQSHASTFLGQ